MDNLTDKLMREIGLEVDNDNHIIDQDNMKQIQFNGKNFVYGTDVGQKGDCVFDPIENSKIMAHMFSYYLEKLNEEGETYVRMIYPKEDKSTGKNAIVIKDDSNKTLVSHPYYNDSLGYADLIFQLGGENIDLSEYDKIK